MAGVADEDHVAAAFAPRPDDRDARVDGTARHAAVVGDRRLVADAVLELRGGQVAHGVQAGLHGAGDHARQDGVVDGPEERVPEDRRAAVRVGRGDHDVVGPGRREPQDAVPHRRGEVGVDADHVEDHRQQQRAPVGERHRTRLEGVVRAGGRRRAGGEAGHVGPGGRRDVADAVPDEQTWLLCQAGPPGRAAGSAPTGAILFSG